MTFSALDVIFIGLSLIICIRVSIRGFIREFFSTAAFFIATLAGLFFYSAASRMIRLPGPPFITTVCSFLFIFTIVFVVIKTMQVLISRFFQNEVLCSLDRALGFFLGIGEALVILIVLIVILQNQPYADVSSLLQQSVIVEFLMPAVSAIPQWWQLFQKTAEEAVLNV